MRTHITTTTSTGRGAANTNAWPVRDGHPLTARITAASVQRSTVSASGSGGRGNLPHVAVLVGECLTYAYDPDALASHARAWTDAAKQNTGLRLPMALPTAAQPPASGLVVVVNAHGPQSRSVVAEPGPAGQAAITVTVGAVTTRVLTTEVLRCYLQTWTCAATLTGIFPPAKE
jgi:hypothetical protein